MKKLILFTCLFFLAMQFVAFADDYVRGYTRSNGTQVNGYYRSSANSTQSDNFSTRGNVNPYTGKRGSKNAWY